MATVALSGIITPTNVVTATSTTTLTNKTIATPTITGVTTFSAGTAALPALTTSGDTNTGIFFPAADTIAFSEGGAESMRIDSSGNLGVGTTSPSNKLDVQGTVASTNVARIKPLSGSNDATVILDIQAGNSSSLIKFTNAGGITFPATQVSSTNANTLDDYEEGNWTPVPVANSGSITSYTSSGSYIKIGTNVIVTGVFTLTNAGTGSSGMTVSGLPFTPGTHSYGVVRETASTGTIYYVNARISDSALNLQTSTNGEVPVTTSLTYRFSVSYII
jgi:hypothetical protein